MEINKYLKVILLQTVFLILPLQLYSCRQNEDYKVNIEKHPGDDIPLTDFKSFTFPLKLKDIVKNYKIEYEEYVGLFIKPKNDSLYSSCLLGFEDNSLFYRNNYDDSFADEELHSFNLSSYTISEKEYNNYLNKIEKLYGKHKQLAIDYKTFDFINTKIYSYWVLKRGNILALSYDTNSETLSAIYTVYKVVDVKKYLKNI